MWYRGNDLRVEDHPALLAAAQRGGPVVPFFVWDSSDSYGSNLGNAKRWWLRASLCCLRDDLRKLGVDLYTRSGKSTDELRAFLTETGADAVFWNRCYEPGLLSRDEQLRAELASEGMTAESFKAELLVEPWELSYTAVYPRFQSFLAYKQAWMALAPPPHPFPCPSRLLPISHHITSTSIHSLGLDVPPKMDQAFEKIWIPGSTQAKRQLKKFLSEVFPVFGEGRCRRHFDGTSRLSPHVRFGELSPRHMYHATRMRVIWWKSQISAPNHVESVRTPTRRESNQQVDGKECNPIENNLEYLGSGKVKEKNEKMEGKQNVDLAKGDVERKSDIGNCDTEPLKGAVNKKAVPNRDKGGLSQHRKSILPSIVVSSRAFLKNLCLRDFSYHVLFHKPDFTKCPLVPEFANFPWAEDDGSSFFSWKDGVTGYPIVDAAMRELKETGWIHNSMRFLLACFLTKYLLLPWSKGLEEFYSLLIDGDHSSNALGWQWTAGSNSDSFPLSCLVNPVKMALRHDPGGSYVRRWVPELAKLPREFVHEPWKAPSDLLKRLGIVLGSTYPDRVILMTEARSRAFKAMTVMKQILTSSNVMRGLYPAKCEVAIKEWPDVKPEEFHIDDPSSSGKMGLLPSLWALLQCDQPSPYLAGSSSGCDPLIAVDTASLVDGALPVSPNDQQECIENALYTAYTQSSPNGLSDVGLLSIEDQSMESSFVQTSGGVAQTKPENNVDANVSKELGVDVSLNYSESKGRNFQGQEKRSPQGSDPVPEVPDKQDSSNLTTSSQEVQGTQYDETASAMQAVGQEVSLSDIPTSQYSHSHMQQLQQLDPYQQMQSFGQLPPLESQHGQPHPQTPTLPQSLPVPSQMQFARHHQLHHVDPQQKAQLPQQPLQQYPTPNQLHPHQPPALQHQHVLAQHSHHQHSQHAPRQPHQNHIHNVVDSAYTSRPPTSTHGLPGSSVAGVPMTTPSVMMGPATSVPDVSRNRLLGGAECSSASYVQQLNAGQFYGFPQVMPVMSSLGGIERQEVLNSSGAINSQKLPVPGMISMTYGMYGSGMFEPVALGGTFPANGTPYATGAASQQQPRTNMQPPYGVQPRSVYFQASGPDLMLPQGGSAAGRQPPHSAVLEPLSQGALPLNVQGSHIAAAAAAAAAVAAGGRKAAERANDVQSNPQTYRTFSDPLQAVPKNDSIILAKSSKVSPSSNGPVNHSGRGQSTRGVAKTTTRGRSISRSRRTGNNSGSGGRHRSDGRGQGGQRARGKEGNGSNCKTVGSQNHASQPTTTLESRRHCLASVLNNEENEFFAFARYLSVTYELTVNTDRHTSKDYVRLCKLKDEYHKQCSSDSDKLKIYRIKNFFSQVLHLEVTGEWDRHNHGGVRGPYVYGIRACRSGETPPKLSRPSRP